MNYIITGAVIYFAIVIAARFLSERSMKLLSDQNKLDLADKFRVIRKYYLYTVLAVIVLFLALAQFLQIDLITSYAIFVSAFVAAMAVFSYMSYRILKQNNFPQKFIQNFLLARGLGLLALIVLIVFVFAGIGEG